MAQMGFFVLSNRYASLDAKRDPLVEIDAVVPWEEFRPTLERVWRKPEAARKSRAGHKPSRTTSIRAERAIACRRRSHRGSAPAPTEPPARRG